MISAEEVAESLISVILENDLTRLEAMITGGSDPNAHSVNGATPLSSAIDTGNLQAVETLLRLGANPHLTDGDGMTPLTLATWTGNVAIADALLQSGADVHQLGRDWPPVYWAAQEGRLDMLRFLAERGADMNPSNVHGTTPLSNAAAGQEDVVRELLRLGARADFRDSAALVTACAYGQTSIAALLITAGADVNVVTSDGDTPLTFARRARKTKLVTLLLQNGAKENKAS